MLEELMNKNSKEEREEYISKKDNTELVSLVKEITENKNKLEIENAKLEERKSGIEKEIEDKMKELKELGIDNLENLDKEINKLDEEIKKEILEYSEALKGE